MYIISFKIWKYQTNKFDLQNIPYSTYPINQVRELLLSEKPLHLRQKLIFERGESENSDNEQVRLVLCQKPTKVPLRVRVMENNEEVCQKILLC